MIRKFFAALMAAMLIAGGLFAEEIKGVVFKKFEDGKVTVLVDGKEKTYKVDPDAKMPFKTKDGKEIPLTKMFSFAKDGAKLNLTVEKDLVTKVQREGGFKKKKDN